MPIQITLVDLAIEGYTSFFISFEPNGKQIKEKFLKSVLKNSFPYSVVIIINIICLYFLAPSMGIAEAKMTTLMLSLIHIFQQFNLFNNHNVLNNCIVGQMKVLGRSKEEAEKVAMKYLKIVGMSNYINAKPCLLYTSRCV